MTTVDVFYYFGHRYFSWLKMFSIQLKDIYK